MEPPIHGHPEPPLDKGASSTGGQSTWGHTLGKKPMSTLHLFFQNVDGLSQSSEGEVKLSMLRQLISQHNIDIVGMADTKTCWDLLKYEQIFHRIHVAGRK